MRKVVAWSIGVLSTLAFTSFVGAIYTNINWWIDWMSLLVAIGAALAACAISIVPAFGMASTLEQVDNLRWDSWPFVAFCNICIPVCASMMLWYHHALTPNHEGFWWPCMPLVSLLTPLIFTGIVLTASLVARSKERTALKMMLEADKAKWQPYMLGEDLPLFKDEVEKFRKQINLHFARTCCMMQIASSAIEWEIADVFISENKKTKLSDVPHPAYAEFSTVFRVKGRKQNVEIQLMQSGVAHLKWNGGAVEELKAWQAVITAIDAKV